jgi:hypothetical protein
MTDTVADVLLAGCPGAASSRCWLSRRWRHRHESQHGRRTTDHPVTRRHRAAYQPELWNTNARGTGNAGVGVGPVGRWGRAGTVVAGVLAAAVLCALTAGCAGTSRSSSDYRHKVANTAQAADSTVNIAELDAELVRDDKTFSTELQISLQQAYSDASSTLSGFDAVLPPHRSDVALQQQLDSALSAAVTLLLEMRVRAGQGREAELPQLIPQLRAMSVQLKQFEQLA